MWNKVAEATPPPTKMLRFFNYSLIVNQLNTQLGELQLEYKSVSGRSEIPENLLCQNRKLPVQQDAQTKEMPNNGKKRIVFIDQKEVIDNLKHTIQMLKTEITRLRTGGRVANPLELQSSLSHSFVPDSSGASTQTDDLSANAAHYFASAKQAVTENNYLSALEWADWALQMDPEILNRSEPLNLGDSADFLQIVARKSATQDLFDRIHLSSIKCVMIESNPTKEFLIPLGKKAEFLEFIKQFQSMINFYDRPNEPLLHTATRFGYFYLVKHLIDSGTPIDLQAEDGRTALMVAAYYGHEKLITYLIDKGADFTHESRYEMTSLLLAAQSGHLTAVQYIVGKFSDLKLRTIHINKAFIHAAVPGEVNIIQYFLGLGADLNYRSSVGTNALHCAALHGNLSIARLLLEKGVIPNITDSKFPNELNGAVFAKSIEMVRLLLEFSADINFSGSSGTPLFCSAKYGHLDIMSDLIKLGADLKIQFMNVTILMAACYMGHLAIVKYLVEECQRPIDEMNLIGQTALITASHHGHLEIVTYLLDHHSDINKANYAGWTALTTAVDNGNRAMIALLLSRGATVQNLAELDISAEGLKILQEELEVIAKNNKSSVPTQSDDQRSSKCVLQ